MSTTTTERGSGDDAAMRPPPPAAFGRTGFGPRVAVLVAITLAVGLGWARLIAMIAAALPSADMAAFGPGMGVLNYFNGFQAFPPEVRAALGALCGPETGAWTGADWGLAAAMWVAMVAAMMLPTAVPVLLAAADREAAARAAGRPVASTVAIAAGYLAVWVAFALVATVLQGAATAARLLTPAGMAASFGLAGTTLIAAGLYQFTPLKRACLARCRHPAPLLAELAPSSLRAALHQGVVLGVDCLGCCWALMAAMFAVGVMNILWIVGLGAVMVLEKTHPSPRIVPAVGVVLVVCGLAAIAASPFGAALLARF
ncbi:DUF2182 domain-containing protein [Siculibacillus lacustris]|nr:DUF2182 domain-containing protein [Siculibacillus lacustris]